MRRHDSATPHLKPLTAQQMLDAGLDVRANLAMRPQRTPRQVVGMWMENVGAGAGLGAIPAVILSVAGRPPEAWTGVWLIVGVCISGWLMWQRGSIDERAMRRSERMIDRAFATQAADYEAQLERAEGELADERERWQHERDVYLDALDQADAEIEELKRGLDEMKRRHDIAVLDLGRERQNAQMRRNGRSTYTPMVEIAPQEVADATEMIQHRFVRGEHLSRRAATDKDGPHRWSESRWDAARQQLENAEVLRIGKGGTAEYPLTLEKALAQWGDYLLHARSLSAPAINAVVGATLYVESEHG